MVVNDIFTNGFSGDSLFNVCVVIKVQIHEWYMNVEKPHASSIDFFMRRLMLTTFCSNDSQNCLVHGDFKTLLSAVFCCE